MSYTYKDRGLRAFIERALKLGTLRVQVGIVGEEATQPHGDGRLTMAQAMIINEYGTRDGHVPERAPVRHTFQNNKGHVATVLGRAIGRVVRGDEPVYELTKLGRWAADEVRHTIAQGLEPANAADTVRRKGSATPLIDEFDLMKAISHRIVRRDGADRVTVPEIGTRGEMPSE